MQSTLTSATAKKKVALEPLKILLVDDIPENILTLESILEDDSRILIKAFSGNEALKLLMEEPIDLVLLDIQMPEMDGVEVAQLLRVNPKTKHIPIIFVSAIARSERPSFDGFETGTYEFIPKPLDIDETNKIVLLFEQVCRLRRQSLAQQKKVQKLEDHLDKFVYILSHDLNAPVRAIENLISWLEEDLKDNLNPEAQENMSLLKNRITRMQLLLNGLLDYGRAGINATPKEKFNLREVIDETLEDIPHKNGFTIQLPSDLPEIITEKGKIKQVFAELFKNAFIHHNNPKGTVELTCQKNDSKYEFVITDDGPGIKPQQMQLVFDIFQTLQSKDNMQTAGIGLSIVKKLVEDRGGRVWISPTFNKGTKVHFTWVE